MLNDQDIIEIKKRLSEMKRAVYLKLFTQQVVGTCQYCYETEQLMKAVAELSEKLHLDIYNFVTDEKEVKKYQIDKIPAIVMDDGEDRGIRVYGVPAGYEFASFLETILLLSTDNGSFSEHEIKQIKSITKPVQIQVFVTPTCPYCPRAALTAVRMALQHPEIKADIVEISEFPHLAQKYNVMGVPKIVVNEKGSFEGALPDAQFVAAVVNALQAA